MSGKTRKNNRKTVVMDGNISERRSASPVQSSQFTIGKLDAGIAVLLGDNSSHLIEFPSLLLPPGCQPGSIVSISCTRDVPAEKSRSDEFWQLQDDIMHEFGQRTPTSPSLRLRNVTQTSVTLEWDRLELATSKLLGLTIWRNGQRVASIPNPANNTSTKLSGLELDTEFTFHLVMKTTAGTYPSNQLKVRTHKITDTSGISACFGAVSPPAALEEAKKSLEAMGAKFSDKIQIDTTHFVCTSPGTGAPAIQYQRALQLSIPTVLPSWVLACQREKRMVQIAAHYLGSAQPAQPTSTAPAPVQTAPSDRSPTSLAAQPSSSPPAASKAATVSQSSPPTSPPVSSTTEASIPAMAETTEEPPSRPEEAPKPASPTDNIAIPPPNEDVNGGGDDEAYGGIEPTTTGATSAAAEEDVPYAGVDEENTVADVVPLEGTKSSGERDEDELDEAQEVEADGKGAAEPATPAASQKVDIDALEDVVL